VKLGKPVGNFATLGPVNEYGEPGEPYCNLEITSSVVYSDIVGNRAHRSFVSTRDVARQRAHARYRTARDRIRIVLWAQS